MTTVLPSFSVIVPTYNRPAGLQQCLKALALLDYPPDLFEVIVVDDGCDPAVPELQEFHSVRIRKHRQGNAGPGAARNLGAQLATGDFLAFTDDDCTPSAGWLRALAAACIQQPGCGIGGATINALQESICSEASQDVLDVMHEHFNLKKGHCSFFPSNNVCFPRRDFLAIGGFNPSFRISEDRDFCDRWIQSGRPLSFCTDAVVHHHHALNIRALFAQHYSYGGGAFRYYQSRKERGLAGLRVDFSFYRELLLHAFRNEKEKPMRLFGAILLTQVANALGYFAAQGRIPADVPANKEPVSQRVMPPSIYLDPDSDS